MSSYNIQQLRRFSTFMLWIIPVIAFFSASLTAIYWGANVDVIWFGDNNIVIADNPPIDGRRLVGVLAVAPALLVWMIALYRLFLLFRQFRRRIFFDLVAVKHIRAYSLYSGLTAVFTVAGSGARRWAQGEFSSAPLWTHIQISPEHWILVFSATIFYFISFAIEEAKAYKDEAESYV